MSETHPTYTEQIDGLLQDVQHRRLGVVEARHLFLTIVDHAVMETVMDFARESQQAPVTPPPEIKLIRVS